MEDAKYGATSSTSRGKWSKSTRRNAVDCSYLSASLGIFDPHAQDVHSHTRFSGDFPQKGHFATVAFHEYMATVAVRPKDRQHKPRKSGAGTKIEPGSSLGRPILPELRTIGEMPVPDVVDRARRNEVDRLLPMSKQTRVSSEPV